MFYLGLGLGLGLGLELGIGLGLGLLLRRGYAIGSPYFNLDIYLL